MYKKLYLSLTSDNMCRQGRVLNTLSGLSLSSVLLPPLSARHYGLNAAHHSQLSDSAAKAICDWPLETIEINWNQVCDEAKLSRVRRNVLWKRQLFEPV